MPKVVDHDKYRQQLLRESFDCFAKFGYSAVTMRDLAKHLGVSTGTLYHYFESKEALFDALIEFLTSLDLGLAAKLSQAHQGVKERIIALFKAIEEQQDYFLKSTMIWVDFYRHVGPDGIAQNVAIQRSFERYRNTIKEFLKIDDPDMITMMASLVNGLIFELMGPKQHLSFERQAHLLIELLKNYPPMKQLG